VRKWRVAGYTARTAHSSRPRHPLPAPSLPQGYGCTAEHMDVVAFALFHHFARRQRWLPALQFFSRLAQHHAAAAVYIAAALRELGDVDQAFSTLTGAMERDPCSAQLLVATSSEFLYAEQVGGGRGGGHGLEAADAAGLVC
jgi:hypothetical protein